MKTARTRAFALADVLRERARLGKPMLEFLREKHLSLGVYSLPVGGPDPQLPHHEDEVYVVLAGHAHLAVGGDDVEVGPGSVVFVPRRAEHRFHSITEPLDVLVVFAPPRSGP